MVRYGAELGINNHNVVGSNLSSDSLPAAGSHAGDSNGGERTLWGTSPAELLFGLGLSSLIPVGGLMGVAATQLVNSAGGKALELIGVGNGQTLTSQVVRELGMEEWGGRVTLSSRGVDVRRGGERSGVVRFSGSDSLYQTYQGGGLYYGSPATQVLDPETADTAAVGQAPTAAAPTPLTAAAMEPGPEATATAAEAARAEVFGLTGEQWGTVGIGGAGIIGALAVGGAAVSAVTANGASKIVLARATQGLAASRVLEQPEEVRSSSYSDDDVERDGAVHMEEVATTDAAVDLEQRLENESEDVASIERDEQTIRASGSSASVAAAFTAAVTARAGDRVTADAADANAAVDAANEIKPFARKFDPWVSADGTYSAATVPAPAFGPPPTTV